MDNLVAKACNNDTLRNLKKGRIIIKKIFDNNQVEHRFIQEKIFVDSEGNIDVIEIYGSDKQNINRLFKNLNKNFLNLIMMNDKINKSTNITQLLIPYRCYKYLCNNNYISIMLSSQNIISYIVNLIIFSLCIYVILIVVVNINHRLPDLFKYSINIVTKLYEGYMEKIPLSMNP